jgi:hypothetical protein
MAGKTINPFRPAVPDPEHAKYFSKNDDGYVFNAVNNSIEFLSIEHAVKVVDLKPDAGTVEIDLYVDRGKTATLKVADADGNPLDGAIVSGLTAGWPGTFALPKDTATVYALDDKPRPVMAIHPGKKLGGSVQVKGGETVTLKLVPLATVTGKLVDTDKQPIAGVTVGLQFPNGPGSELYREANAGKPPVVTAADGSFKLEGVVPGVRFFLSLVKGQSYFVGEPKIGLRQAEAGKTLELGALPVRAQQFGQ